MLRLVLFISFSLTWGFSCEVEGEEVPANPSVMLYARDGSLNPYCGVGMEIESDGVDVHMSDFEPIAAFGVDTPRYEFLPNTFAAGEVVATDFSITSGCSHEASFPPWFASAETSASIASSASSALEQVENLSVQLTYNQSCTLSGSTDNENGFCDASPGGHSSWVFKITTPSVFQFTTTNPYTSLRLTGSSAGFENVTPGFLGSQVFPISGTLPVGQAVSDRHHRKPSDEFFFNIRPGR